MTWARANIKCGSWIALFALLVQLASSFGHFHAIASVPTSPPKVVSALSEFSCPGSPIAQVVDTQCARQPTSDHDPDQHSGDICAICAVVGMVNAALVAAPPVLPLPQIIELAHPTTEGKFARVASASIAFRPRAPPIS